MNMVLQKRLGQDAGLIESSQAPANFHRYVSLAHGPVYQVNGDGFFSAHLFTLLFYLPKLPPSPRKASTPAPGSPQVVFERMSPHYIGVW
jgi:hypothetical protein